jgi:hypothetical protein
MGRTSRAQWLAFGSVALAGCVGSVREMPLDGGGGGAQEDGSSLAMQDSGSHDGAALGTNDAAVGTDASLSPETGTAQEAGSSVDSGTVVTDDAGVACRSRSGYFTCSANVCDRSIQTCYQGSCLWYGDTEAYAIGDAGSCGPCPTCACLQQHLSINCHCSEDSQGTISISCAGCYGSPPARLERLA